MPWPVVAAMAAQTAGSALSSYMGAKSEQEQHDEVMRIKRKELKLQKEAQADQYEMSDRGMDINENQDRRNAAKFTRYLRDDSRAASNYATILKGITQ